MDRLKKSDNLLPGLSAYELIREVITSGQGNANVAPVLQELQKAAARLDACNWQSGNQTQYEKSVRQAKKIFFKGEEKMKKINERKMIEGIVEKFFPEKGFGFIKTDNGRSFFFHRSGAIFLDKYPETGEKIIFNSVEGKKGPKAFVWCRKETFSAQKNTEKINNLSDLILERCKEQIKNLEALWRRGGKFPEPTRQFIRDMVGEAIRLGKTDSEILTMNLPEPSKAEIMEIEALAPDYIDILGKKVKVDYYRDQQIGPIGTIWIPEKLGQWWEKDCVEHKIPLDSPVKIAILFKYNGIINGSRGKIFKGESLQEIKSQLIDILDEEKKIKDGGKVKIFNYHYHPRDGYDNPDLEFVSDKVYEVNIADEEEWYGILYHPEDESGELKQFLNFIYSARDSFFWGAISLGGDNKLVSEIGLLMSPDNMADVDFPPPPDCLGYIVGLSNDAEALKKSLDKILEGGEVEKTQKESESIIWVNHWLKYK